jgi:hypothetical protein
MAMAKAGKKLTRNVEIEVNGNIPIPHNLRKNPPLNKYPFEKMQAGDSFWLPLPDHRTAVASIRYCTKEAAKRGFKVVGEAEMNGKWAGVRIWMVGLI